MHHTVFSFFFFKKCLVAVFYLLLFILPFNVSISQKAPGKLAGKITDASNNQTLNAVNITIKSIKKGTQSILDGSYTLSLPVGIYTVSFTSVGYQQKNITEVEIKSGEINYVDIVLERVSQKLTDVVVTSTLKKESQSAVYNKQKTSTAVSDVISIEAIRRTPDANAGQFMKRVTGVNVQDNRFVVVRGLGDQYNQTMLNGVPMTSTETNRNAFALDLIPSAVIDNVTVNKTATPDMPGNFAGGVVQINTKDFPVKDFYSVVVQTGFSDQTRGKPFYSDIRGKYDFVGFGAGSRDLPKDFPSAASKLGELESFSPDEQQRYLRTVKNNLAPVNNGRSKLNESFQIGYGKTIKFKNEKQLGIIVAITQRKTELIEDDVISKDPEIAQAPDIRFPNRVVGGLAGVRTYSENRRYKYNADLGGVFNVAYKFGISKITLKNLYTQIFNNTFTDRPVVRANEDFFPNASGGRGVGLTYFTEQKRIINSTLSGEHRTGKDNDTRIDWNLNGTSNLTNTPDIRNFVFDTAGGRYATNINQSSAAQALQQNSRVWASNRDIILGGAFNITTPFVLLKNKQIFKAGTLFQNRVRKSVANAIIYNVGGPTLDSILAPGNFLPGGSSLSGHSEIASSNGTYNAGSSLLAAYASFDNKVGKHLRIIWGLRVEDYQQYVAIYNSVFYPNFRNADLSLVSLTGRTTFNFLPSVNTVFAVTKKINIRGAYSKTVVRPELKNLADVYQIDYFNYNLVQGNSGLKSTNISNYDFKFEVFPSAGEIFSFAAFYKQLKGPIEFARPANDNVQFYRPFNVGDAYVKGIELEIRKKIDFIKLLPWLKNVTLFGNGTLLKSKVATQLLNDFLIPKVAEHTLTGQPGYIINAGISIAAFKNSFDATFSYNKTGDYIYQLGYPELRIINKNYPNAILQGLLHTRVNPRDMVDVSISKAFFKDKCKIKINASNLLNSPYILYQDTNGNGKFDEPFMVDDKITDILVAHKSGIDPTTTNIKPQRTYSFSITYTF